MSGRIIASVLAVVVLCSCLLMLGRTMPGQPDGASRAAGLAAAHASSGEADDPVDEYAAGEACAPASVECPADNSGPLRAGPAVAVPAAVMAAPQALVVAALRSRGPDTPQRPPSI